MCGEIREGCSEEGDQGEAWGGSGEKGMKGGILRSRRRYRRGMGRRGVSEEEGKERG